MQCIWKPIPGYNNYYSVSNTGIVRSKDRYVPLTAGGTRFIKGRILKYKTTADGYKFVILSFRGRKATCYLHRLVACAFVDNPRSKLEVNHIDGRKGNNNATNLEWVSHQENVIHAYKSRLYKSKGWK